MQKQKDFGPNPFATSSGEELKLRPLSVELPDEQETARLLGQAAPAETKTRRERILVCSGCGNPACPGSRRVFEEG